MRLKEKAKLWLRSGSMVVLCLAGACKAKQTVVVVDAAALPQEAAVVLQEELSVRLQRELDTAAKLDPELAAKMNGVRPILECVEKLAEERRAGDGSPTGGSSGQHKPQAPGPDWRAHFGYVNPGTDLSIPIGFYNRFWPPPIAQGQPTTLRAGTHHDAVSIPFNGVASAAWVLGSGTYQIAKATSPLCPAKSGSKSGSKNPSSKRSH